VRMKVVCVLCVCDLCMWMCVCVCVYKCVCVCVCVCVWAGECSIRESARSEKGERERGDGQMVRSDSLTNPSITWRQGATL